MDTTHATATGGNAEHIWERYGLGKAPFRVAGFSVEKYQACPGAPVQPGGSCTICGQGIMNVFRVRSADGHEFKVGPDCVAKAGDAGLRKAVDKVIREHRREVRWAREKAQLEDGRAFLARSDVRAALAARPSPIAWRAEQGDTMADWADWMMSRAGATGQLAVISAARNLATEAA